MVQSEMKHSSPIWPKLRALLVVLLGVIGLTIGPCWGARQAPSWAAPGQSPYAQTVPTRLLTPTLPPEPTPASEPEEEPSEDNDDASPTPLPIEEFLPSPTPFESPMATLVSQTPTEPTGPTQTVAASQLDHSTATPTATILDFGQDTLLSATLIPSFSPSVELIYTDETDLSVLSTTSASVPVDRPDRPLEPPLPSRPASHLLWLYAMGLGLLLILGGVFLINRS
jgi:hypothetical protein